MYGVGWHAGEHSQNHQAHIRRIGHVLHEFTRLQGAEEIRANAMSPSNRLEFGSWR